MIADPFLIPAALLLDRLCGEPPARVHPVCLAGRLAARLEDALRRGPNDIRMALRGALAASILVAICAGAASGLAVLAAAAWNPAGWCAAAAVVWICLAPRSLAEHALRVAAPLEAGDLPGARRAVSMLVGRNTEELDAHGVARACVESVAENLVDGVLAGIFWAGMGLILAGWPGAAGLAAAHRAANTLDALWGRRNDRYRRFGTFAARLDDILNFLPARLALPAAAVAALGMDGADASAAWRTGLRDHAAHESPNSAWSEAAFAGALGLRLGGPAAYGGMPVAHPWLGGGTPDAEPRHIRLAVRLMGRSIPVFTIIVVGLVAVLP